MDQHESLIIPEHSDNEPTCNTSKKKISIPWRPVKTGCGIPEDLHHRRNPFDDEGHLP
jgi:hypothetical protein